MHEHVARILRIAVEIDSMRRDGPFDHDERIVTTMVERLFLTFLSTGRMNLSFFGEHEELVEKAALKSYLLLAPTELMRERVTDTLSRRDRPWQEFVGSIGDVEGAVDRFTRQQDDMVNMSQKLGAFVRTTLLTVSDVGALKQESLLDGVLEGA